MPQEPENKTAITFIDGQNLFHSVAECFGYNYPNFDLKRLVDDQNKWLQICSVFPDGPAAKNKRGINNTHWIKFDQNLYDSCIDHTDYRPKSK